MFVSTSWRPSITLDSAAEPPSRMVTFESRIKTSSNVARVHVLLSKKSVVFLTPPSCWPPPPPNEDESPPPLGFCTIITTTSKNATMIINAKKIVKVLILYLYYYPVISLLPEFGLQRNHFFRDFSKLKFYMPGWLFCSSFVPGKPLLKSLSSKLQAERYGLLQSWNFLPEPLCQFADF